MRSLYRWPRDSEMLAQEVEWLNSRPMNQLRFDDFAELKTGRDAYSGKRLAALEQLVSAQTRDMVRREFADYEKDRAACLRWVLRGLNLDKAIRKVYTDVEITRNAIHK